MSQEGRARGPGRWADDDLAQLGSWGWREVYLSGVLGAVLLACPSEARRSGELGEWC